MRPTLGGGAKNSHLFSRLVFSFLATPALLSKFAPSGLSAALPLSSPSFGGAQATSFCASLLPSRLQGPQAASKACPCYQSHLRLTSGDSAPSQEEVELELPHPAVVQNKQLRTEVEKKKCRNCSCNIKSDGEFLTLSRFWRGVSALEAAPLSWTWF